MRRKEIRGDTGACHFLNRAGYPQMTPIYAEKGARVRIPWDRWRPVGEDAAETAALPLFRQLENLSRFAIHTPTSKSFASVVCLLKRPEGPRSGGSVPMHPVTCAGGNKS